MQKPPPDFRTNFEATHPPILIDGGLAILENDKIERHIMKSVPGGHNLFVQDKEVATLIENLYSKLKLVLVKKDEHKNNVLLAHLKRINDHLQHRNSRFLTGDTMCCFDCELMWVFLRDDVDMTLTLMKLFLSPFEGLDCNTFASLENISVNLKYPWVSR